jgi:hypothetical protein
MESLENSSFERKDFGFDWSEKRLDVLCDGKLKVIPQILESESLQDVPNSLVNDRLVNYILGDGDQKHENDKSE